MFLPDIYCNPSLSPYIQCICVSLSVYIYSVIYLYFTWFYAHIGDIGGGYCSWHHHQSWKRSITLIGLVNYRILVMLIISGWQSTGIGHVLYCRNYKYLVRIISCCHSVCRLCVPVLPRGATLACGRPNSYFERTVPDVLQGGSRWPSIWRPFSAQKRTSK